MEVAEALIDDQDHDLEEANLRTAVGRTYHAAFRALCDSEARNADFIRIGSTRDHRMILSHLETMGRDEWAGDLRLLRRLRNQCDYDEHVVNLKERADIALEISRNLKYEAIGAESQ